MKKQINTNKAPTAIGPYSQAVVSGNLVFISGQIPLVPETGEIISSDFEAQVKQVMLNIKAILNEAGLEFSHVVRSEIFLTDLNDFTKFNEIYASFFIDEVKPARFTVQVSALPKGSKIEIACIAAID